MRSNPSAVVLGLVLAAGPALPSMAAGHRDWTVVPLGSLALSEGTQTIRVARPYDRFGVIPSPLVLTAIFDAGQALAQPIEIRFVEGERELPAWTVQRLGQMYMIGIHGLAAADNDAVLTLRVEVQNAPPGLALMACGSPDFQLAGDHALGPLELVVKRLEPGVAREYLNAAINMTGGQLQMAKADLARLAEGEDETVARFARAALRRIRFAEAEARLQSDFSTHYRLGLYAQQCGLFRAARLHFHAAVQSLGPTRPRPTDWLVSDAWYRLGEMMERCGDPIQDVAEVMERAGREAGVRPNVWDVWVPILLSEEYQEERDGESVTLRAEMTPEQIERIRREWRWVEQMVYGASGGHLQLNTHFTEVPDTSVVPYGLNVGWLYGPLDEAVPVRGGFDCVMSFRPRGPSVTGGADCGPNGAALTDIGTWCGWEVYLHEWNHQFDWTVRTSEAGDGYPITHHSDSCGHQPIPSMGYGHRASMRYYVTPAMYHRLEPADPDDGQGYVRNWWIGQPIAIHRERPKNELPAHHAAEFDPARFAGRPLRFVAWDRDFVDLEAVLREQGTTLPQWYVTPATTYVLSPQRQEVRVWLGHNDGLAMWVNGELVHRGDYYAIAKFEDQNWPNMLAKGVLLQQGWNRIDLTVESWPPPRDKGHGFAVRICGFDDQPVEGLVVADERTVLPETFGEDPLRPRAGQYYRWDEVRDDYYRRLPRLRGADLAEYGKLADGFDVCGSIGATRGYVALGSPEDRTGEQRGGLTLRGVPERWDRDEDSDLRLNNLLDWNREAIAVYPLNLGEPQRHLLVMRPEAIEAYLTCLDESPAAEQLYGGRSVRDRVLGYVQVGRLEGEQEGVRVLIVAETCLPTPLPDDEEDLLMPLAD